MASVFLGDLDDFIAPGQACVNPLFTDSAAAPATADSAGSGAGDGPMQLALEDDGVVGGVDTMKVGETKPDLIRSTGHQTAKVSLDDCLACSGCVTSAETVLITQQSTGKLQEEMKSGRHAIVVASISPQARASLALHLGLTPLETHARLLTFLRGEGIHHLLDSSLAADFSLLEAGEEFVQRYRGVSERGGPPWAAPPHTVGISSTRQFNVELGREESVCDDSPEASANESTCGVAESTGGLSVSRKRGRPLQGNGDPSRIGRVGADGGDTGEFGLTGHCEPGGGHGSEPRRGPGDLLVLTSACPGWVCYAEKTAPEALPCMSAVKSSQQILGTLSKRVFPRAWGLPSPPPAATGGLSSRPPRGVFHVAIAQCYDKKLEASRKDFRHDDLAGEAEVDLVLTTTEVLELMEERAAEKFTPQDRSMSRMQGFFKSLPPADLVSPLGPGFPVGQASVSADGLSLVGGVEGEGAVGGNSGGYLEYVFRHAAQRLFGRDLSGQPLAFREGRNPDFRETRLEVDGKVVLCFAYAYGFRNIQSILAKARRRKCPYHFVEVMACPSGCLNGGGQVKPKKEGPKEARDRVSAVSRVLREGCRPRSPHENPLLQAVYRDLLGGEPGSRAARALLHTTYHNVPKLELSNPHMSTW